MHTKANSSEQHRDSSDKSHFCQQFLNTRRRTRIFVTLHRRRLNEISTTGSADTPVRCIYIQLWASLSQASAECKTGLRKRTVLSPRDAEALTWTDRKLVSFQKLVASATGPHFSRCTSADTATRTCDIESRQSRVDHQRLPQRLAVSSSKLVP
eukprot:4146673-Pleurochrysis_carterae.AAC.1